MQSCFSFVSTIRKGSCTKMWTRLTICLILYKLLPLLPGQVAIGNGACLLLPGLDGNIPQCEDAAGRSTWAHRYRRNLLPIRAEGKTTLIRICDSESMSERFSFHHVP